MLIESLKVFEIINSIMGSDKEVVMYIIISYHIKLTCLVYTYICSTSKYSSVML